MLLLTIPTSLGKLAQIKFHPLKMNFMQDHI